MSTQQAQKPIQSTIALINNSPQIQEVINTLKVTVSASKTGITNFVVNHEDPYIVDEILKKFTNEESLYNETTNFDAVELQYGRPGKGASIKFFDELIYGTYKYVKKNGENVPDIDPQTGMINREPNGFVNRSSVIKGEAEDTIMVIKNIDYSLDFCKFEETGVVNTGALFLFDRFRHPRIKNGCRLVLVSNKPLNLQFKVNVVEIPAVSEWDALHIVQIVLYLFEKKGHKMSLSDHNLTQLSQKIVGMTHNLAYDCLLNTFSIAVSNGQFNSKDVIKMVRKKVNTELMRDGAGLTQLTPRPWEDYICSSQSNFTYDVKKLMRDFSEIGKLNEEKRKEKVDSKIEKIDQTIESLKSRMPHVIVLHGKGGVGKSAFPVHLAGLLELDIWDLNLGASFNKFVGQSGENIRNVLKKVSSASHVILRIDEYDRAIGATGERGDGMHEVNKQVESEFMNFLQNYQEEGLFIKKNIFLVLTTNHIDNFTGPLLRSGRADLVIDIGSFDTNSMEEAFHTCARRMKNRGAAVVGFDDFDHLQKEIDSLDVKKLAEIAIIKNFTVRDLEQLITEMSAHRYYYNKYGEGFGIPWNNESFIQVLENSEGSVKSNSTGELKLGDRDFNKKKAVIDVELEDENAEIMDLPDFELK